MKGAYGLECRSEGPLASLLEGVGARLIRYGSQLMTCTCNS